jgi:hypothetical protein
MPNGKNYKVLKPLVKALFASGDYSFDAMHKLCVHRFGRGHVPSVGTMRNWYSDDKKEWDQAREINKSPAQAAYKKHNDFLAVVQGKDRPELEDYKILGAMLDHARKLEEIKRENDKFILNLLHSEIDESVIFLKFIDWFYSVMEDIAPDAHEIMSQPVILDKVQDAYKRTQV